MITNSSLHTLSCHTSRITASIFVMTAVTTLAALFFTHIIPLNSPLASLACGIGFTSLNLFPIFYIGYLIYRTLSSSPDEPQISAAATNLLPENEDKNILEQKEQSLQSKPVSEEIRHSSHKDVNTGLSDVPSSKLQNQDSSSEQIQALEGELRFNVLSRNVAGVLQCLEKIHSCSILRTVLVPSEGQAAILSLATYDYYDERNTKIVRAIMEKVTRFNLVRDVMFFDNAKGKKRSILACNDINIFNLLLDAIGEDNELLRDVLMWKCPDTGETLLHYAVKKETKKPNSEKGFAIRIVAEAQKIGILRSVLHSKTRDNRLIFDEEEYFGWHGGVIVDQIMSSLNCQELCEIVDDLMSRRIYLGGDSQSALLKYRLFVRVLQKKEEIIKYLLESCAVEDRDLLVSAALQIAKKYQRQDVIDYLSSNTICPNCKRS